MLDHGSWRAALALSLALLAACGGGGGGSDIPGAEPARVDGLIIAHRDLAARDPGALGSPPEAWPGDDGSAALAHADWSVAAAGRSGVTADDGSFAIAGLAPGRYLLELSRTLAGDLLATALPFGVGDDGGATVLGEIAWGRARATSTFTRDGRPVREIFVLSNVHVVLGDGQLIELGDGTRLWQDVDRDGDFDTCTVRDDAAGCVVAQIESLLTLLPERLRVGQHAVAQAVLTLSDGSAVDVTSAVSWQSANQAVAAVDGFGRLEARAPGSAAIRAGLEARASLPATLEVAERGALLRIHVQNASCYHPYGVDDGLPEPLPIEPPIDSGIWAPSCRQVVEVGGSIHFLALGEFAEGEVQDLTGEVEWAVEPAALGDAASGVFTGRAPGSGRLTAMLDAVRSDPTEISVVTEPTLVSISIYAADGGIGLPQPAAGGARARAASDVAPCPGCGGVALTVLRGDRIPLGANGEYDTGIWRDLTHEVAWSSAVSAVATVDVDGTLVALDAGETAVTASLGAVTSEPAQIRVVDRATLEYLWIHQEGELVVARGDQRFFSATGSYDLGFSRDVTGQAAWHRSDPSVARFDEPGVLTGVAAGDAEVWAEADGVASERIALEVFATSELDYCDPANVNRGTWTDGFNRVLLESDCATYTHPGVAALRFTVTEKASPGGIFDPCLDLYVFQGDAPVRTIREEGCGEAFVPAPSAGLDDEILKYQLRAFWDLKDDQGQPVPEGTYQIHGRFYLYYDPVVSLTVRIE